MTWSRTLSLVCRLSGGGIFLPFRRSQAAGCGLQALHRHLWIFRWRRPCPIEMELVELQSNDELKAKFNNSSPPSFFRDIALSSRNFPKYTVHVQRIVAMLGGTYCYEQLFSKMKYITSLLPSRSRTSRSMTFFCWRAHPSSRTLTYFFIANSTSRLTDWPALQ